MSLNQYISVKSRSAYCTSKATGSEDVTSSADHGWRWAEDGQNGLRGRSDRLCNSVSVLKHRSHLHSDVLLKLSTALVLHVLPPFPHLLFILTSAATFNFLTQYLCNHIGQMDPDAPVSCTLDLIRKLSIINTRGLYSVTTWLSYYESSQRFSTGAVAMCALFLTRGLNWPIKLVTCR